MDFWKWEKVDSESLKRVVFKTNPKPFHVDIDMKHLYIACPLVGLLALVWIKMLINFFPLGATFEAIK